MDKKNLPIAIVYCVFSSLAIINLFFIIFFSFLHGNNYSIISAFFIGISVFLYSLFNCLFHWITHNTKTLKSLNKIRLITEISTIYSILFYFSFIFISGPQKWVFFGINSLFFAINLLLFFIWTNIPYFIAEIFKDIMFLPLIIFAFSIVPSLCSNIYLTLIFVILLLINIISIIFKYIYSGTKHRAFYNTSRILNICSIILCVCLFYAHLYI